MSFFKFTDNILFTIRAMRFFAMPVHAHGGVDPPRVRGLQISGIFGLFNTFSGIFVNRQNGVVIVLTEFALRKIFISSPRPRVIRLLAGSSMVTRKTIFEVAEQNLLGSIFIL